MLSPSARTTLVSGLLPVFYGVCGAVFVEAGRVGAAGAGQAGGSGGGASVGGAAECCLATLLAMVEDEYVCKELLLPKTASDGTTAPYYFFSRNPPPMGDDTVAARAEMQSPGGALFALLVGYMKSNLRPTAAATPVAQYGQALAILHRLLSLAQAGKSRPSSLPTTPPFCGGDALVSRCAVAFSGHGGAGTGLGTEPSWATLWETLASLLRLFSAEPLDGSSLAEAVCTKALHVFNYVITYGDVFLPSAELYDKMYYEVLRAHEVFEKLHQHLAWSGGSRALERALRNVRSIATQVLPISAPDPPVLRSARPQELVRCSWARWLRPRTARSPRRR